MSPRDELEMVERRIARIEVWRAPHLFRFTLRELRARRLALMCDIAVGEW